MDNNKQGDERVLGLLLLTLWVHLGAICSTIVAAAPLPVASCQLPVAVVAALGKYFNFSATSRRSASHRIAARSSYLFALIVYSLI